MRHNIFLLTIVFLLNSCCFNKNSEYVTKIDDSYKIWIPYKSMTNLIYQSQTGSLIDTLTVIKLDTAVHDYGEYCHDYNENRECELQSIKFQSLKFHVQLHPTSDLRFYIKLNGSYYDFYFNLDTSKQAFFHSNTKLIDSLQFNSRIYHDVLSFTDSARNMRVYYNYNGILRYIINTDTMSLIK